MNHLLFIFKSKIVKYLLSVFLFLGVSASSYAQSQKQLSVQDFLEIANKKYSRYDQVKITREINNIEQTIFRNSFLPTVGASLSAPSLNRSISSTPQDDGSLKFRESNTANSSLSLNINQSVPFTGGTLSISNSLSRLDQLGGSLSSSSYSASWLRISYSQSLGKFNPFRSTKRTITSKYDKQIIESFENREALNIDMITLFFDVFISKRQYELAIEALENSKIYYEISKEKFEQKRIRDRELTQVELSLIENEQRVEDSRAKYDQWLLELKSVIGFMDMVDDINLLYPGKAELLESLEGERIRNLALRNYSSKRDFDRISAEEQIRKIEAEKLSTSISIGYGLNNSNENIGNLFVDAQNQQSLNFTIRKRLFDWNETKNEIRIAHHKRQIVDLSIREGVIQKEREIQSLLQSFQSVNKRITLNAKRMQLAKLNYQFSKEEYLVGKINLLELNTSKLKKDQSEIEYIESLKSSWQLYYQIRKNTLYDFQTQQSLITQ